MKGVITRIEGEWMVRYDAFQNDYTYPFPAYNFIPIHPDMGNFTLSEGREVEFEIIKYEGKTPISEGWSDCAKLIKINKMNDWKKFNLKHFWFPMIMLVCGLFIGYGLACSKKNPSKDYPVEIMLTTEGGYLWTEADSVVGNIAYRDGIKIILNNVACIKFK